MQIDQGRPHLELLPASPSVGIFGSRFRARAFTYPWHYHPEAELTLIVRGSGLRFVGDSIEAFEPGDLVLLGPGVPHTWQSQDAKGDLKRSGVKKGGVESVVFQFAAAVFEPSADAWSRLPELASIGRLVAGADCGLAAVGDPLRAEVSTILRRAAAAPAGTAGQLIGLLEALDALAAGRSALRPLSTRPLVATPNDAAARSIHRVLERVRQSIARGDAFTQADAAALARMSPASFSRFFRRHVGRTFVRYVNEWRVGLACRRLVAGDDEITTIAFECGFGNLSNFNRRFRQIKGVAPREFRRRA